MTTKCNRPNHLLEATVYKSKQILFLANLFFSSVSGQKALKKCVCILPYTIAVKSYRTYLKQDLKTCGVIVQNRRPRGNILKYTVNNLSRVTHFCFLYVNLATVQI